MKTFLKGIRPLGLFFLLFFAVSVHAATNLVPNPSVETPNAAGTAPLSWSTDKWGTNSATFQYLSAGYQSGHSVQVTMASRSSGDAKWYFDPIPVSPNTTYTFTEEYKSNVATHIVLMTVNAAGKETYTDIATNVPASADWKQFTKTFKTSATAKKVSFLHLIAKKGTLQIDEISLMDGTIAPPPPPTSPTCTLSANPSNLTLGSSTVLTWTTTNASTFSITNGVGSLTPVAGGTKSVAPLATTTYTGTAVGTGTTTCATTVNVFTAPVPPPTPTTTPTTTPSGWVPNPSAETPGNPTTAPASWVTGKWGTNTPTYTYVTNDGHDGTRSVKMTMTNYKSGDAKWYFTPQPLAQGDYRFSAWYKTNTIPHVVAMYIRDDGSEDYFGLPDPQPNGSGEWQHYSDMFSVPSGVKSVSLFFFLTNNGYVQVDDFAVTPFTYSSFNRGILTMTFDDGFETNVSMVLPVLDQYGFKTTQCYATQFIEGLPAEVANVQLFASRGHEICSHTVTHPFLTTLTTAQVDQELSHAQSYLQGISGQTVKDFASPYGDYNVSVNTEIQKYYQAHRTTDEGYNAKDNWNPYRLRVQNMMASTTLAQVQEWVSKAKNDKTWLILLYHRVDSGGLGEFDTAKSDFDAQMAWIAGSGIAVERMDDALAELAPQI